MIDTDSASRATRTPPRLKFEPDLVVFGAHVPRSHPELEAPVREKVDRGSVPRDQAGVSEVVVEDESANAQ